MDVLPVRDKATAVILQQVGLFDIKTDGPKATGKLIAPWQTAADIIGLTRFQSRVKT